MDLLRHQNYKTKILRQNIKAIYNKKQNFKNKERRFSITKGF